jgi:hypothetical protein
MILFARVLRKKFYSQCLIDTVAGTTGIAAEEEVTIMTGMKMKGNLIDEVMCVRTATIEDEMVTGGENMTMRGIEMIKTVEDVMIGTVMIDVIGKTNDEVMNSAAVVDRLVGILQRLGRGHQ